MELMDLAGALVGFFLTIMVLSYVFGDNFLFRLAIYIFIGISSGYAVIVTWSNVIWPQLVQPVIAGDQSQRLFAITPILLSALLLFKVSPRLGRIGNLALAYLVGVGVATAIGGAVLGTLLPQMSATINEFDLSSTPPGAGLFRFFRAGFLLLGTLSTLLYFQFGRRSETASSQIKSGFWQGVDILGQVFLAVTLGVLFAGVYSASLTALIERIQFLQGFILPLFSTG